MSPKASLTSGAVGRTLVALTLPMVVGHYAGVAFNLADTYFVAKLGTSELAAMSFTFPVVMVIFSISFGMGIGTAAVVSQAIGRGNQHEVKRLTTHALILALLAVTAFSLLGILTVGPLFRLLGADEEILRLIKTYMYPWYMGVAFLVVPMVGNNAIRATGDTRTPSIIMVTSAVLNIVLDPLMIFGWWVFPGMGLAGAAWATVVSRAISTAAALFWLTRHHKMLEWSLPKWRQMRDSWKRVMWIGIPTAGTSILMAVSIGVVTRFVAGFGTAAVAAWGAGTRLESFSMRVIGALSGVMIPFVGQNWGAGKLDRVRAARRKALGFAVAWGLGNLVLVSVLAKWIGSQFSEEPAVIEDIALYLWIVPIGYALKGAFFISGTIFNAVSRPIRFAGINMFRMFVLYIPLAWFGGRLLGYSGLLAGVTLANIISGLVAMALLQALFRQIGVVETRANVTRPADCGP